MSISLDNIINRNEHIIFRKIEDEYVLVPMLASANETEHIYNLNQVGASVWEKIDGKRTVKGIIDEMADEYEAAPEQIETDVLAFLNDIYKAKIIRVHNEGS